MSALASAVALASVAPGPSCSMGRVMADLSVDDPASHADALDMLGDRNVQGTVIARALTAIGRPVKPITVNRHRNGVCSCP